MESILSITAVLLLIVVANVLAARRNETLNRLFAVFLLLLNGPVILIGLGLLLVPVEVFEEVMPEANLAGLNLPAAGLSLLLAAGWGVVGALRPVRRLMARFVPLEADSPVHALALVLAGYLVGVTLFTLSQGGLEGLAETAQAASIWMVVLSQVLTTLVALAGVGLGVRRNWRETGERLGLGPLRPRYWGIVVGGTIALVVIQAVVGGLWELTNPQESEVVTELTEALLGDIDTVWEWFLLAVGAGVSEELLFRGAIQPIFGLVPTALLFAVLHVQYGFTPVNLFVLLLGIFFGIVRQRTNTTVAVLIHFAYDFVLGLVALLATYLTAG